MIGIYTIFNTISKKALIGGSTDITNSWETEVNALLTKTHENPHLQNSWNKYGPTVWRFQVLKTCAPNEINSLVSQYINTYKTELGEKNVYNIPIKVVPAAPKIDPIIEMTRRVGSGTTTGRVTAPAPRTHSSMPTNYFAVPFQYKKTVAALQSTQAAPVQVSRPVNATVVSTARTRPCASCSGPVYMKNKHYNKLCTDCYSKSRTTV